MIPRIQQIQKTEGVYAMNDELKWFLGIAIFTIVLGVLGLIPFLFV